MSKMSKMPKLTKIEVFYRFNKKQSQAFWMLLCKLDCCRQDEGVLGNRKMERSDSKILGNL